MKVLNFSLLQVRSANVLTKRTITSTVLRLSAFRNAFSHSSREAGCATRRWRWLWIWKGPICKKMTKRLGSIFCRITLLTWTQFTADMNVAPAAQWEMQPLVDPLAFWQLCSGLKLRSYTVWHARCNRDFDPLVWWALSTSLYKRVACCGMKLG